MSETKKRKKPPTAKQLRARAKFARMAKLRAKEARAKKRLLAAKKKPVKRAVKGARPAKKAVKRTVKRNSSVSTKLYSQLLKAENAYSRLADKYGPTSKQAEKAWKLINAISDRIRIDQMKHNPRRGMRAAAGAKRRITKDAAKRGLLMPESIGKHYAGPIKYATIKRRRAAAKHSNGSAAAKRREWAGTAGKVTNSYAPKGSGVKGTVIKMGELKKLYIKGRAPLSFPIGAAMLAYAPKASKRKDQMVVLGKKYRFKMKRRNPEGLEDLGEITQIEYIETKQQFGDQEPVIYYHKLGEEGGERPHAVINEEGLLLIEGGDYTITPEGIRD